MVIYSKRFYAVLEKFIINKASVINPLQRLIILLLLAPALSIAAGTPGWDCKLGDDGITWDCSTSTKPIKNKKAPDPVVTTQTKVKATPVISEEQAVTSTIPTPLPRVQLTKKTTKTQPKKKPESISTNQNPGNWDCVANAKGAWSCETTGQPTRTPNVVVTETTNETGNWNCNARKDGTWNCEEGTEPAPTQLATSSSTQYFSTNTPENKSAIFKQMVSQLSADPWSTCSAPSKKLTAYSSVSKQTRNNARVDIQADYAELIDENNATFTGDVAIKRADQFLTADQLTFKNKEGFADASGDVFYQEKGVALYSKKAQLQLNNNTGQFFDNQFILENSHARGTTGTTNLINKDVSESTNITYSTCEPGKTDWQLEAEKMELNNITGRGTARNVWVEFLDIPFLYTPYISFPIDDRRQSGLLAPTIGSSDTTGVDISMPYYWNIAPNYDATITPRIMSDRGLMLGGEFRYLTQASEGQVSAEILEDSDLNKTRGQLSIQNNTRFSQRLTSLVDLNYLSDDDYIDDFGNSLSIASNRYVKSEARLNYNANNWNVLARVDNYDSIDRNISSSTRPHRRLPQVLFNLRPVNAFSYGKFDMRNEFTYFDHSSRTKSQRLDIHPGISFPFKSAGRFITPRVSVRHTSYKLENQAVGVDSKQNRTLPILSLDSGLFFERNLNIANGVIQTLEPRAFYLYVPNKSQDDIPLFDTSEYDFSFNQLFRENRFSGADRVADANQLTLALTSRFLESSTGKERLRASIGSIIYFDDLNVTLNSTTPVVTNNSSDIVAELSSRVSEHWSARSALQYDPHSKKTQKATVGFHYRNGDNKLFNATYRSRFEATTDDIEQTDISFKWPLNKTWSSVGRWNYSQEHNLTLESFLGIEKDNCCWRFRVIARRYVNDAFDEKPKQGLFFQLELKGLSSFGEKLDSFLEEGILGYQPPKN